MNPSIDRLDIDLETFSELDLEEVGVSRYARHSSTEILLVQFSIDFGAVEVWDRTSGAAMPENLKIALKEARTVWAFNKAFEAELLQHKLGIRIAPERWRCLMVRAQSLSLPGSLSGACEALRLSDEVRKIDEGRALIRTFCVPQTPTKRQPLDRFTKETNPAEWERFVVYAARDITAQQAVWKKIEPYISKMPTFEEVLERADFIINRAGLPIRLPAVRNAVHIADVLKAARLAELKALTGLDNPNSNQQLLGWLRARGYRYLDMKAGHVKSALRAALKEGGAEDLIRALQIRSEVSKSSIAKFAALLGATDADGRLRYALRMNGAGRTGRWSGQIYQPQNLARPAKELENAIDLLVEAVELLVPVAFEAVYASPFDALSSAVRPVVQAPAGHMLADADLAAIESRVLGWITGDEEILRVFRTGRDPYIAFAAKMFATTYEAIEAEVKAGNKARRALAKPPVLGCFGAETLVLTDRGWIRLIDVTGDHRLFDGTDFITHGGVHPTGLRPVLETHGIRVTPDHLILIGDAAWSDANRVFSAPSRFAMACASAGSRLTRSTTGTRKTAALFCVTAAGGKSGTATPCSGVAPISAGHVPPSSAANRSLSLSGRRSTTSSQNATTPSGCAAQTLQPTITTPTAVAGSSCVSPRMPSSPIAALSCASTAAASSTGSTTTDITSREICASQPGARMSSTAVSPAGSMTAARSSVLTTITTGISCTFLAPSLDQLLAPGCAPEPASTTSLPNAESAPTTLAETFDILDAGPRRRFMILTDRGPLIVHNCGYALGAGRFVENEETGELESTGLLGYAQNMGVAMTEAEAELAVKAFRDTHKAVTAYWRVLEKAAIDCVRVGKPTRAGRLVFDMASPDVLRLTLPSGRALTYWYPRLETKPSPWGEQVKLTFEGVVDGRWRRTETYYGRLIENAVQAIARDILANGLILALEAGLDVRMHVHDQIVAVVPKASAEADLARLISCMTARPAWADGDLLLAAEGVLTRVFQKD